MEKMELIIKTVHLNLTHKKLTKQKCKERKREWIQVV